MTQVLHTLGERLSVWLGERRRTNRRSASCAVRLPAGVSMPNERLDPEAESFPLPIMGRTRDLSETGLSLVLPSVLLGAERIDQPGYRLRLVLSLPGGLVVAQADTVYCDQLEDETGQSGYVLGARLVNMSRQDRNHYEDFLQTLD